MYRDTRPYNFVMVRLPYFLLEVFINGFMSESNSLVQKPNNAWKETLNLNARSASINQWGNSRINESNGSEDKKVETTNYISVT